MSRRPAVDRMAVIIAAVLPMAVGPAQTEAVPPGQMSVCARLDAQGREAMQWFINGAFPIPSPWIECRQDNGGHAAVLRRQRSASVPCLLQIYRSGLADSGLWSRRDPPPADGEWTLNVLGQVDPPSAIMLWREKASSSEDPWMGLVALLHAGRLGDRAVLPGLVSRLADPPRGPGLKPFERDAYLAEVADLVAQYNFRPALRALEHLYDPPRPALRWLDLHILQLRGDMATLERRTREKDAAGANALRALYRMRAHDALDRIARDPRHPRSTEARWYLGQTVRL